MTKPLLHYSVLLAGFFSLFSAPIFGQCVGDTTKPFFERCPQNIVINQSIANSGDCIPLEWNEPLAADNCGVAYMSGNRFSGECFPVGTTNIVYTAIDSSQNSATCTFTITVLPANPCLTDTTRPIINCPTNIVINTSDTCAIATWADPIATDNCSLPTVIGTHQSGRCFPLGSTTVVYTATDSMNNFANCAFVITVNNPCATDTVKPVFSTCPANIVASTTGNCVAVQWVVPRATDECGSVSTFSTAQPGKCFSIGISTVSYRATDLKGNVGICSFTVNVSSPCAIDTIKPTILNCPTNIVLTTYDTCAIAGWSVPTATDNCSIAAIFPTQQPGSCFPLGTSLVTYTARDAKNNTATCSFNVTVNHLCEGDSTKPIIANCPVNMVLTTANNLDSCVIARWVEPTITDNCGMPTLTASHRPNTCFNIGTTTVTYLGKDTKNNTTICAFNITVNNPCFSDTINPIFANCPANIVLNTMDTCARAQWAAPTATDNCGIPSVIGNYASGNCFPAGITTVGYAATDARGNRAYCSFTVTVNKALNPCAADFTKPILTRCPANINLVSIDSCTFVNWVAPTATDNCGTPTVTPSQQPNTCFKMGTTTVIYTAKDGNNNTASCSFLITIAKPCAGDITKPRFPFCPSSIAVNTYDSCAVVTWVMPVATDDCSTATVTGTHQPGMCFVTGVRTVTYTAKDANNNTATCSFKVTVTNPCLSDVTKPVIAKCPVNIVKNTADTCSITTWTAPTVSDNCGTPKMTASHLSGACFKVGVTTVTYTAKDSRGNTSLCTFTITVNNPCLRDSIKPVITNCPANISVTTADSCAIARWTTPIATDNCTTPTLTASHQSATCFKVGLTTVTYTAKDAMGNTALCTFTVNVINPCFSDTIKPVIKSCPANIALNSADSCSIARWTAPTATDNCTIPTLTASHASGLCFRVGSTTVTYTAKDAKGNTALCTFKVTVSNPCFNDTIKPVLYNCPVSVIKTIPDTAVAITWKAPTALDNCGIVNIATTNQPNSLFKVGVTTVTYTASDSKNNKSTCSFTVTIKRTITACSNDTVKPVFTTCPANITVSTTSTSAVTQWTAPTATDNCSTPSLSTTYIAGSSFPIGTTAVVYTAKDAAGNLNYCRFNVIVNALRIANVLDSTKCYALVAKSSKKAMSIANASTIAGAYAVQWMYSNALNQQWKIVKADSNSYNLTNKLSDLNLDTRWGALTEGARLTQWGKSAIAATQKWQLTLMPDGFYKVINKGSGRALSVSGGSAALTDGTLLIQSTYAAQTSQQWSITEVPCTNTVLTLTTNDVIDMTVQPEFKRARIEWTDNTGFKNDYYEVQKLNQTTGEFEQLDIVNNKSFSNAPSYQSVYDNAPVEGENAYRVKVVYMDSMYKFSPIKTLNFNGLETVKLFPNPANDYVDIDLAKFNNEAIGVYLYNSFGKKVAFQLVQKDKFSVVHFDISNQEMGNYIMRITAKGKRDVIRQLQIVR
jgi:hypothetical protein